MGGFELVKEINFNIFESKEVDLMENQEQKKRKRKIDDYDYEDDFIEPFEGEDELVDIECKLENFFIHKGEMKQTPKRIISTYRNRIKKKGNKKDEKPKEEIYEKKVFRANVDDDIKVQIEAAVGFSLDDEEEEKIKKPKRKRVRNKEKVVKEKEDKETVNDNVLPVMNGTLIKAVVPPSNDFNVPQHVVNSNLRLPICKPEEIEEVFYLKKSLIKKNPNLIHPMARNPLPYNPYNNRPISKSEEGIIMNEYPTHFFSSSPNLDIKKSFRSKSEYKNLKRNDMQHKNEQQDLLKMFGASSPNYNNRIISDPNAKEKILQSKIKSNQEIVCVNANSKQQTIKSNQEYVELSDAKNLKKQEPKIIEPVMEKPEVSELQQSNSEALKRKYVRRSKQLAEELSKDKVKLSEMINMKVQEMSNEFLKESNVNQPTVEPVKESVVSNETSSQPVYGPMKDLSHLATEQVKNTEQSTDFPNMVIKIKNMPCLKSETSPKLSKKLTKKPTLKSINEIPPSVADNYSESVILVEEVSSSPKSSDVPSTSPCTKTIHSLSSSNLLRYYLKCKLKTLEDKLNDPITSVFFFYFNLIANDQSSEDYVINYSLLEKYCSPKQKEKCDYSDPKNLFTEETLIKFEKVVDEHLERALARLRSFSEDPDMYNPTKKIFLGFENDSFIKNAIVFFYLICCKEIYKGLNYKKAFEHAKVMVFELFPNDVSTLKLVRRITMVLRNLLKENNTLV